MIEKILWDDHLDKEVTNIKTEVVKETILLLPSDMTVIYTDAGKHIFSYLIGNINKGEGVKVYYSKRKKNDSIAFHFLASNCYIVCSLRYRFIDKDKKT